jgi:hypothetical protein
MALTANPSRGFAQSNRECTEQSSLDGTERRLGREELEGEGELLVLAVGARGARGGGRARGREELEGERRLGRARDCAPRDWGGRETLARDCRECRAPGSPGTHKLVVSGGPGRDREFAQAWPGPNTSSVNQTHDSFCFCI